MERGSDKNSPRVDDELERESTGMLQGSKPTRVQEEQEVEPTVMDDGEPATHREAMAEGEEEDER